MTTTDTSAPGGPTSQGKTSVTSLSTPADETRERWIEAACRGHLSGEQLGEKLGVPAAEAQGIVDARLRDVIRGIVDDSRDG